MHPTFFSGNRKKLIEKLEPGSFVALAGFGNMQRDTDQPFKFQQDGNFWYLTGISEPDWRLFLDVDSGDEWLVAPTLNYYQKVFDGGLSPEEATKLTGVKKVLDKRQGKELLADLLKKKKRAYTLIPKSVRTFAFQPNTTPRKLVAELRGVEKVDIHLPLAKMRAIKQPEELAAIQSAVNVTADSLLAILPELKEYTHTHQVDAKLYYEFRRRGAVHGFDPVISTGRGTYVLHDNTETAPLQEWLLLDVGARVDGYSADITRTIPTRPPKERHLRVYEAVQRMHDHFLQVLKPGVNASELLRKDVYPYIGEEMVELGIIKKPKLDHEHVFKFMPHAVTHGLGIDVHDPLGRPEVFLENMVLTNEVGIYIPEEGFGIRIENDMVITKDGARNLAPQLPISLQELASLVY